jgi:hypothetical protein
MKCYTGPQTWSDSLELSKLWIGAWNVRSGVLKTVSIDLAKCILDFVGVQVR